MKKVLYKILFLAILLLPLITYAETAQYELDKEYLSYQPSSWSDSWSSNRGYNKVLGISDDYVFVSSYNAIYKHDKDLKYVSSVSGVNGYKFIEDSKGDYFYGISSVSLGSSEYEYYIRKIDTDFKELSNIKINFDNNNSKSFSSYIISKDNIYAFYITGSYPSYEYHNIIIDKSGNIISDKVLTRSQTDYGINSAKLYNLNNKVYYAQNKKVGSSYNSEIYSLNEFGESNLVRTFENTSISDIQYDYQKKNYVISYFTYQSNGNKSDKSVMTLDYNFDKVLLEVTSFDFYGEEFLSISVTDKYYIFNVSCPQGYYSYPYTEIHVYDKNFNRIDSKYYGNLIMKGAESSYSWSSSTISIIDNDIYVSGSGGMYGYSTYIGDYLARYTIDDLYKVNQEILAGEGIIDQSELSAFAGEEVTFSATPAEGYILSSLKVVTDDGKVVETTDNKFIMPNQDVTIQAEFVKEEPELPPEEEQIPEETPKEENPNTSDQIIMLIIIMLLTTITIVYYNKKFRLLK